jgi:trigger factor
MKVQVDTLDPCRRQLVVEAPETEVQAAWEVACHQVQREARLPGFRRGKVPRTLVRARFADEVRRAVLESLVPAVYRRAVDEAQLQPVDEPDVKDLELEEGRPLRFTAVIEIKPAIALTDYTGMAVRHSPQEVADADVEATLANLAESRATLISVDRPARVGDFVVVDYELALEGDPPRAEPGYAFEVGSGRVLPEMDEAVIGLETGAERKVPVRVPDTHAREELRGKTGRLRLRVVEVKEKELPALDDELAKALGGHETLTDLRAALRAELVAQRERQNRRALEEAVVDAVLERHGFDVPESLVFREIAHRVNHARERLRRDGVDPDRLPWDYEKLSRELKPDATRAVRRALLIEAIADKEELAPTEAELDAELARLGEQTGRAPQAVRALLERQGDLEGMRHALRERKVLDLLVGQARVQPQTDSA